MAQSGFLSSVGRPFVHRYRAAENSYHVAGAAAGAREIPSNLYEWGRYHLHRLTWLLLLVILCAIVLRVVGLGHESLDGDEVFSLRVALLPVGPALQAIRQNLVHPPLYYFLLKIGVDLWGWSPLGVRLWSLLFGVATVPLVAILGSRLPGARYAGLLAAAIVATNETLIFYSQQGRSYSLYAFLVTLLIAWLVTMVEKPPSIRLWLFGCGLMVLLVYTHYIASIYIFFAIAAVIVCHIPKRTKALLPAAGAIAALSFVPWVVLEIPVYHSKHGIGENLQWEGHPDLYTLRRVWASSLGVASFRGATALTFLLVVVLAVGALRFGPRPHRLRDSPVLVGLAAIAFLPVLFIFALSVQPFGLPIFGLRQFLPSLVVTAILCCWGLESLALRVGRFSRYLLAVGGLTLLVLTSYPTLTALSKGPLRIPYKNIALWIGAHPRVAGELYTTWPYGIGGPVNYYCASKCVQPLPSDYSALPASIILLYRPEAPAEARKYKELLEAGFSADSAPVYYTDGQGSSYGTRMVNLVRHHADKHSFCKIERER